MTTIDSLKAMTAKTVANDAHDEYKEITNFVQRRDSYRKSHEKGALYFAQSLDIDDDDSLAYRYVETSISSTIVKESDAPI